MNRVPYNQARVSCHTPWQRPLSLLLAISFCLLSAASAVAAEQFPLMLIHEDDTQIAFVGITDDKALDDTQLNEIRGRFIEASLSGEQSTHETGVILWDEIKTGSSRNSIMQDSGHSNSQNNTLRMTK